jgi:hypothetical protein
MQLIRGSLAVLLIGASLVLGVATSASACDQVDAEGICLDGADGGGGGSSGGNDPGPTGLACPGAPDGECINEQGHVWVDEHQCYAWKDDPQPPANDPVWSNNNITPADGAFWTCSIGPNSGAVWFVPNGESPIPDAETIARQLVARAPFEVADVHVAPPPTAYSYVNFENWLWVPRQQWHDVSASLSISGATVTLTATPSRVHWRLGTAGETQRGCSGVRGSVWGSGSYQVVDELPCSVGVDCYDPGQAWVPGMTDIAKTTCSWTYLRASSYNSTGNIDPSLRGWTITGQFYYDVSWSCVGNCSGTEGSLGEYPAPSSTSCLTVYERQSVTVNPHSSAGQKPPSLCS